MSQDSEPNMSMHCQDAAPLVASYLDGELSEAQAGPLRRHLLDCVACRSSAQDLKNLKRWLAPTTAPGPAVPAGFSARIARRAFAGDRGAAPQSAPEPSAREILPFVRELTALAAGLLAMLAIGLELARRPAGEPLRADPTLGEIEDQLGRLNAPPARTVDLPTPPARAASETDRGRD